jgi:hypothetical protein
MRLREPDGLANVFAGSSGSCVFMKYDVPVRRFRQKPVNSAGLQYKLPRPTLMSAHPVPAR